MNIQEIQNEINSRINSVTNIQELNNIKVVKSKKYK